MGECNISACLTPGVFIIIVVINHHSLGRKPPHPDAIKQQARHLGYDREPGVRRQSSKVEGGEGPRLPERYAGKQTMTESVHTSCSGVRGHASLR